MRARIARVIRATLALRSIRQGEDMRDGTPAGMRRIALVGDGTEGLRGGVLRRHRAADLSASNVPGVLLRFGRDGRNTEPSGRRLDPARLRERRDRCLRQAEFREQRMRDDLIARPGSGRRRTGVLPRRSQPREAISRVRVPGDRARRRRHPQPRERGAHFAFRIPTGTTHLRHGADGPTGRCRGQAKDRTAPASSFAANRHQA